MKHNCSSKHRTFAAYAKCAGNSLYKSWMTEIVGEGRFGIILHFRVPPEHRDRLHLRLYATEVERNEQYEWMRSIGSHLSGTCTGQFDLVELEMS